MTTTTESVTAEVTERDGLPPLDEATTPEWLRTALAESAGSRQPKPPAWVPQEQLPPLPVGGRRLNDGQVQVVLAALARSKLAEPAPLGRALKEHLDPAALEAFAWKLFEIWQGNGAPAKEKWALHAVGLFGGDASAMKLAPLIRAWPGESLHQRAVFGLECLRAIGSDTALMQLHSIAQKVKFAGLKRRARIFMDEIARERRLSPEQLEDRIVPDLGLDERGSRVFDFGPRQFRVVLGPDLKPLVRDEKGKVKPNLPKPGAKDEAARANAAVDAWKLLKKQLSEALKVQKYRLERAMLKRRRWSPAEFENYLVRHPLMINLVRRLLWGGFDADGKLARAFRVTEDRTYADVNDAICTLEGLERIGIVHPLHLTAEELGKWGEVFGDYEIIGPFPQLARRLNVLQPVEEEATELTRFSGPQIPAMICAGILKTQGWEGGGFHWEDRYVNGHYQYFPEAELTAIIEEKYGGVGDTVQIERVYFMPGQPWHDNRAHPSRAVPLKQVDPVVLSEVLGDLAVVVSKGT